MGPMKVKCYGHGNHSYLFLYFLLTKFGFRSFKISCDCSTVLLKRPDTTRPALVGEGDETALGQGILEIKSHPRDVYRCPTC